MKIPKNHTEADVLKAIEDCVNLLAPTFTFGYYDVDDIKQQGRLFALELLEKERYDETRPLPNFLYTHIKNRLINLKRDKFRRCDAPCQDCYFGRPCTPAGYCEPYQKWYERNAAKSSIMQPAGLAHPTEQVSLESEVDQLASENELMRKIDEEMPVELRAYWKQMHAGIRLHKTRRERVLEELKKILGKEIVEKFLGEEREEEEGEGAEDGET